tara:strand:+ start:722 stop:886 length:165 start_codon:yes stop_codon:yes gene_type:complete
MIEVGDLVKIKESSYTPLVGKVGIVLYKGTWSRDVYVIECGYETRIGFEKLEKL